MFVLNSSKSLREISSKSLSNDDDDDDDDGAKRRKARSSMGLLERVLGHAHALSGKITRVAGFDVKMFTQIRHASLPGNARCFQQKHHEQYSLFTSNVRRRSRNDDGVRVLMFSAHSRATDEVLKRAAVVGKVVEDGMPRYPDMKTIPGVLRLSDYIGTWSFAMTGTLLAASKGLDCFGAPVIGMITAVGGGTIRDFVLGAGRRAFWMEEQEYVYIALVTGIVTFFGFEYMKKNFDVVKDDAWWIEASDALGVGAFCVIGCMNGVRAGVSAINCIACGVMTATGGGVVRDVIVGRPPRIFHSYATAYATPAAAGAATYLIARRMGVSTSARIVAGASVGIVGRLVAEQGNVRLPLYESEEAKTNAKAKGDKRL